MKRRDFLKQLGLCVGAAATASAIGPLKSLANPPMRRLLDGETSGGQSASMMTYRVNHTTGEKVSLLGYGMMRLPMRDGKIDQEMVNQEVDYAIEHGVNYFDTSPHYCGDHSEEAMGIALSRHPRDKYLVATKMSNWGSGEAVNYENSLRLYRESFKFLKVDVIDYYLLHGIGGGGMASFNERFIDNGILDFLCKERDEGRIRNLGFSYHGDVKVFDWLLDHNDKYKFSFCQIQMNYIDWRHASSQKNGRKKDADAEYLYEKAEKLGVQVVVMEPLLGGRLARISDQHANKLAELRPGDTPARWAFRWVGSHNNILTTLSGMTTMEVLRENVATFSPLDPCNSNENAIMEQIATDMAGVPVVPCTACAYCMPCPAGVDIPGNFTLYNKVLNDGQLPDAASPDYKKQLKAFQKQYKKKIDKKAWATRCVDCEECLSKCPQSIRIPNQLQRISELMK